MSTAADRVFIDKCEKSQFIMKAELFNGVAGATQDAVNVSRMREHTIQISGVSVAGASYGAFQATLQISADGISFYTPNISVMSPTLSSLGAAAYAGFDANSVIKVMSSSNNGNAIGADGVAFITRPIHSVRLVQSGAKFTSAAETTDVSVKYFGRN